MAKNGPSKTARLGACAMTTKFLDNKIFTFKILLSWRFPRKIAFWTIFLSAPLPTPPEKRKFYFYCRLAFSEVERFARIASNQRFAIFSGPKRDSQRRGSIREPRDLRGPAAILFISSDTCSDSTAKLFSACFSGGIAQLSRDTLQNGVSHRCACVKLTTRGGGGGIAPVWGSADLP